MSEPVYVAAMIAITAAVTWAVRAAPYLLFGGREELPAIVVYLGKVLPCAIMITLVVYGLRNIEFGKFPYGLAELCSVALVVGVQIWKKNTVLSVLLGTVCYMVLIRTVFA